MPLKRQSVHDSYTPFKPAHLIWYGDALKPPTDPKATAPVTPEKGFR